MLKSVVFLATVAVSSAQLSNIPKLKRIRTEAKRTGSSEFGRGNLRSTGGGGAVSEGKARQLELNLSMDFQIELEEPSEEEEQQSCTANEECASGVCDCRFYCILCSTHPLLHFDYWCGTCAGL
ncbi:hypothetical protein THAOC_07198 [Thalassiosira oceanica]|uniref:Uncharacterized protein n=1 Tax=Thalassiosira oceanica TaxID=159749 RepID=K0T2I1_THAOC|nr:hypothetical protein THAOC_07198 [Thalassiosira oceanica]|eukprot:EJK71374.1 hypothetical protein THAOC_07198 [Thalassiosira oceanica]